MWVGMIHAPDVTLVLKHRQPAETSLEISRESHESHHGGHTGSQIVDVDVNNFEQAVIEASATTPVLLDFWASWCAPCKALTPILERIVSEAAGGLILAKVNADEQQQITMQLNVRSLPTVKLIHNRQIIGEFMGAQPEQEVRAFLAQHLGDLQNDTAPEPGSDIVAAAIQARQQGMHEQAVQMLSDAHRADPNNALIAASLVESHLGIRQPEQAQAVIDGLDDELKKDPKILGAKALLGFAKIAADVGDPQALVDKTDSHSRYQLAICLIMGGQYEQAFEMLLDLVRQDRKYGDDAARKALIGGFDLLGREHPLVSEYRRALSGALN